MYNIVSRALHLFNSFINTSVGHTQLLQFINAFRFNVIFGGY